MVVPGSGTKSGGGTKRRRCDVMGDGRMILRRARPTTNMTFFHFPPKILHTPYAWRVRDDKR